MAQETVKEGDDCFEPHCSGKLREKTTDNNASQFVCTECGTVRGDRYI